MTEFLVSKGIKSELTSALASAVSDPQMAQGEITPVIVNEFKEKMQFEAFEKATEAYNYGRDEVKQISPTYLTLYDKYGPDRKTVDYINNEAFMQAVKNNMVMPGTYTVLHEGKVETVTIDQERINQLRGTG